MEYSIEFEDLFNWQLESDRHYYAMIYGKELAQYEELENIKPTIVKVEQHETNIESPKVRRALKKKLLTRSHLLAKASRTKSRS